MNPTRLTASRLGGGASGRRWHAPVAALGATVLAVTLVGTTQATSAASGSGSAPTLSGSSGSGAKTRYVPPKGPHFNNPLGTGPVKYRNINIVQQAIAHAHPRSTIRVMSWNIMSRSVVTYLLDAQKRGVRVLAIMDSTNKTEIPNPSYHRLHRGLKAYNEEKHLRPSRRSKAMVCVQSCRGSGGQAHAKYFLFSHTGAARKVLIEGSSNLTAAAATNQWNDIFVMRSWKLYKFAMGVFTQAMRDRKVSNPYVVKKAHHVQLSFAPEQGENFHQDPRMRLLNQVRCHGAKGAGRNGHTVIRMTPDVMRGKIGMAAASRVRMLYQNGCDVRIGYTVLGRDIHRVLTTPGRRGKVPLKHLVQDFNGDGEFDNYFHLKVLTINGHLGNDRGAYVAVNGSANLSGLAKVSDENIAVIRRRAPTLKYQSYIDYWWTHFPSSKPTTTTTTTTMRNGQLVKVKVDPYAHVDMD
jgi:hypothetical protein